MAELKLNVVATDLSKHQFIPAKLLLRIGQPNPDMQTCEVYFECTDDDGFDPAKYTWIERKHSGALQVPLSVIAVLVNPDGSYNTEVFNQWLLQSDLQLAT
jgi:hypothetical protein